MCACVYGEKCITSLLCIFLLGKSRESKLVKKRRRYDKSGTEKIIVSCLLIGLLIITVLFLRGSVCSSLL